MINVQLRGLLKRTVRLCGYDIHRFDPVRYEPYDQSSVTEGKIVRCAIDAPRVTSNSSGCGQSNSSTREAGQGTVSLSLFPGQELQRLL
ncbi:hypothetical protein J2R83_004876 [Bradyrhizobium japonicum]|nr:hypothetical protein [Bradyrhizobium japonicum]